MRNDRRDVDLYHLFLKKNANIISNVFCRNLSTRRIELLREESWREMIFRWLLKDQNA